MWIRYTLIIWLGVIMGNTLANAQSSSVLEMQCPKVRDYGGYPTLLAKQLPTGLINQLSKYHAERIASGWLSAKENRNALFRVVRFFFLNSEQMKKN